MVRCFECFCESGFEGRELQKLVDREFPGFICEAEICSPFSSSPVQDNETVAFILIDPLHYDKERNVVVPEAFQELTNRDLSVIRVAHVTKNEADNQRAELIERGKTSIPPKLRLVDEVCLGSVSVIRAAKDASGRMMAVYDTALEDVKSHASVFTRSDVLEDRRLRKVVRNRIHEVFAKARVPYDEFASGLAVG